MATYNVTRVKHQTLSGTTADLVQLKEFYDFIEVSNRGTVPIYVDQSGTTAVAAADDIDIIEAGSAKTIPAVKRGDGVPGNTTTPCHKVSLVGNGNDYSVTGVQ